MMGLLIRANEALSINPQTGNEQLSTNGSDWLWAAFALYAFCFVIFYATSFKARSGEKIFHYIFTIALLVGSITYFAWASGLGYEVIRVVNDKPTVQWTRQIFWAKYVFWVVEFPSVIIALGLLSGVSWATIVYNVTLSWAWVVSYLITALTGTSSYKWGFYAFGTVAYLLLAVNTLTTGLSSAKRFGVSRDYLILTAWTNFLWLCWPIAFGVSDGGNEIGVTPDGIFFGVLDVLLTPVLAFGFVVLARNWDYSKLNLAFTRYGRVHNAGEFPEKAPAAPSNAAVAAAEPAAQETA